MSAEQEFRVGPEISIEFRAYEEFCAENGGRELAYLEMVGTNPLEMDPITLAFSMRHLVRMSKEVMETLLKSSADDKPPSLRTLLATKGIQLDKSQASLLRNIIFSFRDCSDERQSSLIVRAFQLMTLVRQRNRVELSLGESYNLSDDGGWTAEDFGGDESLLETVRSVERASSTNPEEY
jgi:hypothetical protein